MNGMSFGSFELGKSLPPVGIPMLQHQKLRKVEIFFWREVPRLIKWEITIKRGINAYAEAIFGFLVRLCVVVCTYYFSSLNWPPIGMVQGLLLYLSR